MPSHNPLEAFLEAQRATEILRARRHALYTFGSTRLPYVFLAESVVNEGDVVLRRGEVMVESPKILAPGHGVSFEGFELDEAEEGAIPILINRWVKFPPAKYLNSHRSLEVVSGPLEQASEQVLQRLDGESDIRTGVIRGPEALWGFSILGYVGQMVAKSTPSNVGEYFERYGFPPSAP